MGQDPTLVQDEMGSQRVKEWKQSMETKGLEGVENGRAMKPAAIKKAVLTF